MIRSYEVHRLLDASVVARPSESLDHSFLLALEVHNVSSSENIQVTQVSSLSAGWKCAPILKRGWYVCSVILFITQF